MKVLVRAVTLYYVGELVEVPSWAPGGSWLALGHCSWVADTGRFHQALATGVLNEVEPYPAEDVVLVAAGAVVDMAPWNHELPSTAK